MWHRRLGLRLMLRCRHHPWRVLPWSSRGKGAGERWLLLLLLLLPMDCQRGTAALVVVPKLLVVDAVFIHLERSLVAVLVTMFVAVLVTILLCNYYFYSK